jgi:hypothetical protein
VGPKVNAPATSSVVVQGVDVEGEAEVEDETGPKVETTVSGSPLFLSAAGDA